jgi:hypothetical protein
MPSHFFIDFEKGKACNLHVAKRPLTNVVFFPGDTDVTGDVSHHNSRSLGDKPREVTIEAAPQLANRVRRWVSHRSVELGIASDSEPGT